MKNANMKLVKVMMVLGLAVLGTQAKAQESAAPVAPPACSRPSTPIAYYTKWGNFLLGVARLDLTNCVSTINLPDCNPGRNDYVSRVQFSFVGKVTHIRKVKLTYDNGGEESLAFAPLHLPGTKSGWHDLTGAGRCIRKIEITGDGMTDRHLATEGSIIRIRAEK